MAIYKANDLYQGQTRATWISSPVDESLQVNAIPDNFPTLVTVNWKQSSETIFSCTGYTGTSPSDYVLTGLVRIRGANQNLPAGSTVNCINHEEFFNGYNEVVADTMITMEQAASVATPDSGKLRLYANTDGKWYKVDDAGTETELGQPESSDWIQVADAATMEFDLNQTARKLKYRAQLEDNRAFLIKNVDAGKAFMIRIMQDGTGSRTVSSYQAELGEATVTIAAPGVVTSGIDMKTGTPVVMTTDGALPTGITAGTTYYWIRVDATTGNLASSKANAIAGTAITTSGTQSGTHTLSSVVIWPYAVTPTLTTTKYAFDDLGFVCDTDGTVTGVVMAQDL